MYKKLDKNSGLVGMDYTENYHFICQKSTQGFYFNNSSASLS